MTKVTRNPIVNSSGGLKTMRPRYMVSSQSNTFTPVGTAMIVVIVPKNEFTRALDPMVKKWCSHTVKDRSPMAMVARTSEM